MSLVSAHKISMAFGGAPVLDNVSLDIQKGQRISFLGRNGTGKSTFLKILAGEMIPDSGEIVKAPGVRVAYLPQEVPQGLTGSVFDIVAKGTGLAPEKIAILKRHSQTHVSDENHSNDHLVDIEEWRIPAVIERVLQQVQLDPNADVATLSGGLRRRVILARALVREPELLLLDEPTNHLDIDSITWLESFLINSRMTILFVTHDRRLLKRLATRIIELDRGNLYDWSCDYETFLERKRAVLEAEEREWENFDKKLAQEEVWIRRGIKARRTRNEGRVRALKRMRDERRKRREKSGTVSMMISEAGRSGEIVLETNHVSFSYGNTPVIKDLNITLDRSDRIGIIGPNGSGKTTLINILVGKLTPQEGVVKLGTNLKIVYFDQLRELLDPEKTVWENVAPNESSTVMVNGSPKHVISYLQDFLFTSDRAKSPVKQLSGGERNRLLLARLFSQPANLLIFDEPTNDLDTETLELLEEILMEYKGTVLVVSHDREFLNNVVTTTLVFEGNGQVKEYVGGYDDWERQRTVLEEPKQEAVMTKEKMPVVKIAPDLSKKKLSYREKEELTSLPQKIETLEAEHEELNLQMANPEFFGKPGFITSAKERLTSIEQELELAYKKWEELENRT